MKTDRLILMEKAPVPAAVLKLALPSMLAMLVQIIYGLTDTYFIGQTGNASLVAAISLSMPFAMLIQAFGNIFAIGGASYISRMLGEQKRDEAKRTTASVFYISILSGFVITALFSAIMTPTLKLLGTSEATIEPTRDYLMVLTMLSFIPILQVVLAGLIRSEGATKQAMFGIFIGTGLNIVLDYLFIIHWAWGIKGAAWATLFGNAAGVLYYLLYFKWGKSLLTLSWSFFRPDRKMMAEVLEIGLPAAFNALVMSVSHIVTNNIAMGYGDETVAANGLMMRMVSIVLFLIMGVAQGYQPFAGYNYGAKNYQRLISAFKVTLLYTTGIALVFSFCFFVFKSYFFTVFLDHAGVAAIGEKMLKVFLWALPLFGVHFTIVMTFQATGRAFLAFVIVLARQCLLFIPLLFILNRLFGFEGFIWAQPLSDILTSVLSLALFVVFLEKLLKIKKEA